MLKNKFIYFASSLALSTLVFSHPFDVSAGGEEGISQVEEFIPRNWPKQEWSKFESYSFNQASPEHLDVLKSILSKTKLYIHDGKYVDYYDTTVANVNPAGFIDTVKKLFRCADDLDTSSLQSFENEYSKLDSRYWSLSNVLQAVMSIEGKSPEHMKDIVSFLLKANQSNFQIEESTSNGLFQSVIDLQRVISILGDIDAEPLKQITQNYEKLFPKTWRIDYCAGILNALKNQTVEDVEFRASLLPTGRARHNFQLTTFYLDTAESKKAQLTEFIHTLNTLKQVPSKPVDDHGVLFKEGWNFLTGGKLIEVFNNLTPEDREALLAHLHSNSLDWSATLDTMREWIKKPQMSENTAEIKDPMMENIDGSVFEQLSDENE